MAGPFGDIVVVKDARNLSIFGFNGKWFKRLFGHELFDGGVEVVFFGFGIAGKKGVSIAPLAFLVCPAPLSYDKECGGGFAFPFSYFCDFDGE